LRSGVKNISHAKAQRRKALPRFESDKTSERFVREELKALLCDFAALREKSFVR